MAAGLPGNEGVYFVPAFVGLGAPHWDPEARGTLVGLTRGTTGAHLARAALEAMCYSTAEVLEAMEAESGVATLELRVDGGAASNDWMMRFQSGLLGVPVLRAPLVETTALGAAALAGMAAGVWSDAEDYRSSIGVPDRFIGDPTGDDAVELMRGWRRAVHAARAWSGWTG